MSLQQRLISPHSRADTNILHNTHPCTRRKTVGYDSGMATGAFGNRVIVYSTLSNDPQPYSSYETGLTAGNRWVESRLGTNLVVKVKGFR